MYAASQILRQEGHTDAANVVKQLQEDPDDLGSKLRKAIKLDLDTPQEKAEHMKLLSLIFRRHESVESYDDWARTVNSVAGYRLIPCYKTVAKSKVLLRPEVMKFELGIITIMILMLNENFRNSLKPLVAPFTDL